MRKCVIEKDDEGCILVCHPDGQIEAARDAKHARRLHDRWAKHTVRQVASGVLPVLLEWRGFSANEVPGTNT